MRKSILPLSILLAILAPSFVTGCASIEASPMTARLIVSQAVMRYVEHRTDWAQSAQNIIAGAQAVKASATGEPITLVQLREIALDAAGLDSLSPADQALAMSLIDAVVEVVAQRVGKGHLEGLEDVTTLAAVADWAIEAARTYAPAGE